MTYDIHIIAPMGLLLCLLFGALFWKSDRAKRIERRIGRVTNRRTASSQKTDVLDLRRKSQAGTLPVIGKILDKLPSQEALRARMERAGLNLPVDIYLTASASAAIFIALVITLLRKPPFLGVLAGLLIGMVLPHLYIGHRGNARIKKFLSQFPDSIDFIVRGLRSGLPVTESMNMVGVEMEDPIRSVFSGIGESIRLGVPVEKALQDTAKKMDSTEFNFFVTSIILQRETGGNLSEILSNLSDVLRKRFMMRMKIKAMSSEAKASAIIVGSLPFVVIAALLVISPNYLDPFFTDYRGYIAAAGGTTSLLLGLGIMFKMTRFEI